MGAEDEGVFIESGSFRVDRSRALETLKEHQLEDAESLLLPWARCAVLLGADSIHVDKDGRDVSMRFGGKALDPGVLKDPFQALFDEPAAEDEPARQLAVGILAAQRLSSSEVRIGSGPDRQTELGVSLRSFRAPRRALEKLRVACAMLEIPLFLCETRVSSLWEAAQASGQSFRKGTARGFLVDVPPRQSGRVHLYRQGVRVGETRADLSVPAVGHVNDDSFRLNASHSGVLQDMVLDYAVRQLEEHSSELLRRMLAVLSAAAWSAEREQAAAWLRHTASGFLTDPEKDSADPIRKALWEAPLFETANGERVSLAELWRQCERSGSVTVARARFPDPRVFRFRTRDEVVWMPDPSDYCLENLFEGRLRQYDWKDSLRDIAHSWFR
ncbi:MAG: hypothetical protein WC728_08400 [Elusimicrobiota bacterium]